MGTKSAYGLGALALASCILIVFPTQGFAQSARDVIVKPFQDDMELCREALAELDRQAVQWLGQLKQWYAFFDSCAEANSAYTGTLLSNLADSEMLLDTLVKASADTEILGATWMPGYVFSTVQQFEQFRKDAKSEVAKERTAIDSGEYPFGLASLGNASRNAVQSRRKEHENNIEKVRASIEEKTFHIYFPALGQVTRASLEARLASDQKSAADALASYDDATKPRFGFESRQELENALSSAQAGLENLEKEFQSGQPGIFRHLFQDSTTLSQTEDFIKRNESLLNELEESLAKGEAKVHFPVYGGHVTENWLKSSMATKQKNVERLIKSVAEGTYSVGIAPGWGSGDANYLRHVLKSTTDPKAASIYQKALERIAIASNLDIEKQRMEITHDQRYMNIIKPLFAPEIFKLKLEIEQRKAMIPEWNRELDFHRQRLQRSLRYLEMLKPFYKTDEN